MTISPVPGGETALTARLAEANGFDLDALPENRAGQLSDAQRRRLRVRLRASRRNSWVPKIGCFAVLAFLGYGLHAGTLSGRDALPIAFLALVAGWAGFVVPRYGRFRRDVSAGTVAAAEGSVTRSQNTTGTYHAAGQSTDYYYVLGTLRFRVSEAGYYALDADSRYRIYYLPDARTDDKQVMSPMVNIEAL